VATNKDVWKNSFLVKFCFFLFLFKKCPEEEQR
jgi:hypothetical protein